MYDGFVRLLNMSFAAGVLAAVVALLRLLLKKAPRKIICILWALVALRLVCPVSIGSSLSAFNLLSRDVETNGQIEYFEYNGKTEKPMVEFAVPTIATEEETVQQDHTKDAYLPMVMKIWLAGVGLMLLYAFISYLRLRSKVAASIPLQSGVMASDDIPAPFLFGMFRPIIYVPSGVEDGTLQYILLHERAHIRRGDHWWKPLGWVLLSLHWFNPLIWLAYVLFCRDIEIACDERVTRNMNRDGRAAYSEALLQCSLHRRSLMVCPLAFGEVGTKERVKNVLKFKKPGIIIVITAVLVVAVVAVCFLTGPKAADGQALTMEDVYRLAQQGGSLTWEDFEAYAWEEAESDRYARRYEIDEQFEVIVESYGLEYQPDTFHLRNKDINAWIDIRTGDILAFTSRPTFGGADGPDSVTVTESIDYPELFARYDAGGEEGEAAEAILREHRDEALKYCMRQFDAGILEGLNLESTGTEMGMYHFWHSELGDALLESPFVGVAEDWQEWSAHVRNLYERNGYDEALFNDTVPASKCYAEILMEEETLDFAALFASYDAGGEEGKAAEVILQQYQDEALKYCMRQFDAGILEGLQFESTGVEMTMYHFWKTADRNAAGQYPSEDAILNPQDDWQQWSGSVRRWFQSYGYDETILHEELMRLYAHILLEESAQWQGPLGEGPMEGPADSIS